MITCRIIKLRDSGLLMKWISDFIPNAHQCLDTGKSKTQREQLAKGVESLALSRLTGAFALLLIGFLAALLIFIAQTFLLRVNQLSAGKKAIVYLFL